MVFHDNWKGVGGYQESTADVTVAGRVLTVDFDQSTTTGVRSHGTNVYSAADKSVDKFWCTSNYACMEYNYTKVCQRCSDMYSSVLVIGSCLQDVRITRHLPPDAWLAGTSPGNAPVHNPSVGDEEVVAAWIPAQQTRKSAKSTLIPMEFVGTDNEGSQHSLTASRVPQVALTDKCAC